MFSSSFILCALNFFVLWLVQGERTVQGEQIEHFTDREIPKIAEDIEF